jgi:hypothetical protein
MPKKEWTPEQLKARRAALAKGRETVAANRALKRAADLAAANRQFQMEQTHLRATHEAATVRDVAPALVARGPEGPTDGEPEPEMMPSLDDRAPPKVEDPLDEMGVSEPPVSGLADPFERFLADLDPETRDLLTEEDGSIPQLEKIWTDRVKEAKDARREVARKQASARASRLAKTDAGLISPEDAEAAALQRRMNRKVSWIVDMVRDANGNFIDEGYRVDGRIWQHGEKVTGTYGEWLSYIEMNFRARNHEMDFEGKGLLSEQRRLSTGALTVNF